MAFKRRRFPYLLAVVLIGSLLPLAARPARALASTAPRIAITIDDGYNFDHRIVDFLTSQGIAASAFLIGSWAQNNPSLVKELNGLGWDICDHTQNHAILTRIPDAQIRAEISACQSVITSLTGQDLPFMRPPGGAMDARVKAVISSMGYIPVLWNFDSQDAVPAKASIQDRVNFIVNTAVDGNIVLFHFGGKGTLELVTGVVKGLQQRGFSFVTLKELYGWKDVIRGGESGPGLEDTSTRFYFSEGNTRQGFDEWMLVTNPGDRAADLDLQFLGEQGQAEKAFHLEPGQRASIPVNEQVPWRGDVATIVQSSQPVAAERMLYFNRGRGFNGGSLAAGQTQASKRYYFAEGSTRPGFEEWLVLLNPSASEAADVGVRVYAEDGSRQDATLTVPPMERITKRVNDLTAVQGDVSLSLTSRVPVIAERTEYFSYAGRITGSDSGAGSPSARNQWYFAEGSTRNLFESYLSLFNPCRYSTLVKVLLPESDGNTAQQLVNVPPMQRKTLHLNEYLPADIDYSIHVESLLPVVAERSTYFQTFNVSGGYCSSGAGAPGNYWIFPEGSTSPGNSEWLSIFNPSPSDQEVSVRYRIEGQDPVERQYLVPRQGRTTVEVAAEIGQNNQVSVEVQAAGGVVAERSLYFARPSRE